MKTSHHRRRQGRKVLIAYAVCFGAAAALIAYYCLNALIGGAGPATPAIVPAPIDKTGAVSASLAVTFLDQPRTLPALHFTNAEGRDLTLSDFRNRPVLLNIWATWCVPCRQEMPSLDRLQAQLGPTRLTVLPLSIDRQGMPVVEKFYRDHGLTALGIYLDGDGKAGNELGAVGVPTTLFIDRDGREVGRKVGAAAWDSPSVLALLRDHLGIAESAAP